MCGPEKRIQICWEFKFINEISGYRLNIILMLLYISYYYIIQNILLISENFETKKWDTVSYTNFEKIWWTNSEKIKVKIVRKFHVEILIKFDVKIVRKFDGKVNWIFNRRNIMKIYVIEWKSLCYIFRESFILKFYTTSINTISYSLL